MNAFYPEKYLPGPTIALIGAILFRNPSKEKSKDGFICPAPDTIVFGAAAAGELRFFLRFGADARERHDPPQSAA
jgi:hypothetical protein